MRIAHLIHFALMIELAGCAAPAARTEVMLEVRGASGVAATAAQLHVRVTGGAEAAPIASYVPRLDRVFDEGPEAARLPRRIALVPLDEQPRGYWIEARAELADGSEIATARAIGGYAIGRTVLLPLTIEDACVGVSCDAEQTCDARGACADARVDAESLADLE